jgi:hypothetical protein
MFIIDASYRSLTHLRLKFFINIKSSWKHNIKRKKYSFLATKTLRLPHAFKLIYEFRLKILKFLTLYAAKKNGKNSYNPLRLAS